MKGVGFRAVRGVRGPYTLSFIEPKFLGAVACLGRGHTVGSGEPRRDR